MSNIYITVEDQTLYVTNAPKIAAQGIKENYVVFSFSSDWDGFGKSALFYRLEDEDTVYESVVDATGRAVVPFEVTQKDGKICLGVCGVNGDVVKTSEIIKYKIVKGRYTSGEESRPPTPGIYEQMLALAGSMVDALNNTPWIQYEEDSEYELPVHTINDSAETAANTWSAKKIRNEMISKNQIVIISDSMSVTGGQGVGKGYNALYLLNNYGIENILDYMVIGVMMKNGSSWKTALSHDDNIGIYPSVTLNSQNITISLYSPNTETVEFKIALLKTN